MRKGDQFVNPWAILRSRGTTRILCARILVGTVALAGMLASSPVWSQQEPPPRPKCWDEVLKTLASGVTTGATLCAAPGSGGTTLLATSLGCGVLLANFGTMNECLEAQASWDRRYGPPPKPRSKRIEEYRMNNPFHRHQGGY